MDGLKFKIKGIEYDISFKSILLTIAILIGLMLLIFGVVTLIEIKNSYKAVQEFFE